MAEYDLGSIKGIGIKSIEQTSSQGSGADNPITITLDNDTTQTLHVYNGSDGVAYDALGTCSTNAASASTTPTLEVVLSNYEGSTIANGFSFNVVFTYGYTYDGQPNMSVNGGTAKPVTVGGIAAGSGAFAAGRAYRFTYTGSNFDCLSNCNLQDLPDLAPYAKNSEVNTKLENYIKGKIGFVADVYSDYTSYTSPNDLINNISNKSEVWIQTNNNVAQSLYNQGIIPTASAGVMHVINTYIGGRCLVELYADNGTHYHYETSNSTNYIGTWIKDVRESDVTFKAGDTWGITSGSTPPFTADCYSTDVKVLIPLPKSAKGLTATVALSGNCYVRYNGKNVNVSGITPTGVTIIKDNLLRFTLTGSFDNYYAGTFNGYFTITFS